MLSGRPPVISVIGYSGSGKTTLIEKLIPLLRSRGCRLAVIKHDAHAFEIDYPGKDSWRFYQAGADEVLISSSEKLALVRRRAAESLMEELLALVGEVDLVVTEGYKTGSFPKLEVVGPNLPKAYLATTAQGLLAVAAADPAVTLRDLGNPGVPVFSRDDSLGLADMVVGALLTGDGP